VADHLVGTSIADWYESSGRPCKSIVQALQVSPAAVQVGSRAGPSGSCLGESNSRARAPHSVFLRSRWTRSPSPVVTPAFTPHHGVIVIRTKRWCSFAGGQRKAKFRFTTCF
jgi:hypothetical protein